MRILAVGAHPDDLELLCAGTLAKYAHLGHDVVMCHACKGDKGHFIIPPDELTVIRRKEAQDSASKIGAESISLELPDCEVFIDRPTLVKFIDLIRISRPDVIITNAPTDYMPDHVAAGKLVFDASFHASVPSFKTDHPAHNKVPPVFYMDTIAGVDFSPTEYVDITGFVDKKKEMMNCHQSQVVWLKEHDNLDVMELIDNSGKFRGLACGVPYAEGFTQAYRWLRLRSERLLP